MLFHGLSCCGSLVLSIVLSLTDILLSFLFSSILGMVLFSNCHGPKRRLVPLLFYFFNPSGESFFLAGTTSSSSASTRERDDEEREHDQDSRLSRLAVFKESAHLDAAARLLQQLDQERIQLRGYYAVFPEQTSWASRWKSSVLLGGGSAGRAHRITTKNPPPAEKAEFEHGAGLWYFTETVEAAVKLARDRSRWEECQKRRSAAPALCQKRQAPAVSRTSGRSRSSCGGCLAMLQRGLSKLLDRKSPLLYRVEVDVPRSAILEGKCGLYRHARFDFYGDSSTSISSSRENRDSVFTAGGSGPTPALFHLLLRDGFFAAKPGEVKILSVTDITSVCTSVRAAGQDEESDKMDCGDFSDFNSQQVRTGQILNDVLRLLPRGGVLIPGAPALLGPHGREDDHGAPASESRGNESAARRPQVHFNLPGGEIVPGGHSSLIDTEREELYREGGTGVSPPLSSVGTAEHRCSAKRPGGAGDPRIMKIQPVREMSVQSARLEERGTEDEESRCCSPFDETCKGWDFDSRRIGADDEVVLDDRSIGGRGCKSSFCCL